MKIVISRKVPKSGIDLLKNKGFDLDYHNSTDKLSQAELINRCQDADALWSLLDDNIDAKFIQSCPNLRVIANYAVGYDNIDLDEANNHDIPVTITPDVLSNATADLAFALLLGVARRLVEGHQFVMDGKFDGWGSTLLLGSEISGKTLGVLGAGRIGSVMARRGLGFDMNVLYHAQSAKPYLDDLGCNFVDLDEILKRSDFLSIHLPLNEQTDHLINRDRLLQMKTGAYLINTGRGAIVDEDALVELLKSDHLAGAGIDVYENEPEIHPGLKQLDNVILLPHIGSATVAARNKMSRITAQSIIAELEGKPSPHRVN